MKLPSHHCARTHSSKDGTKEYVCTHCQRKSEPRIQHADLSLAEPPTANSKAAAGRARKEETANKKKEQESAKAEAAEAAKWEQGAKSKSKADEKAEKAVAAAAKKSELERLKKEEEESLPDAKTKAPKAGAKKEKGGFGSKQFFGSANKNAGPPGINDSWSSFSASNLDDAIAAMSLVSESSAKDKVGAKAGAIDVHPERRFKVSAVIALSDDVGARFC